jgi:hypothetical protein
MTSLEMTMQTTIRCGRLDDNDTEDPQSIQVHQKALRSYGMIVLDKTLINSRRSKKIY